MRETIEDLEAEQEAANDPALTDLPPGALDGDVVQPSDPSVLVDTDGDGVVVPPQPEAGGAIVTVPEQTPPTDSNVDPDDEGLVQGLSDVNLGDYEVGDEIPELRSADSRTFLEEGGELRTEFGTEPFFVETDDGVFKKPDPAPQVDATSDRWEPEVGQEGISFAPQADDDGLGSIDLGDGRRVEWSLVGAFPRIGLPSGDDLDFQEVFRDVDLELRALPNGVKETIVIEDSSAPSVYEFVLDLTGIRPIFHHPQSSIELVDADTGERVGFIPSGFAVENAPSPETGSPQPVPVNYELLTRGGQTILRLSLDETWLDDPARRFPIKVDPTVYVNNTNASGSAYIKNTSPDWNSSSWPVLEAGGQGNLRSYLARWDIPVSKVKILGATYGSLNINSYSCNAWPFQTYRIAEDWDPGTVTWNHPYPGGPYTPHGGPAWDQAPLWEFNESHGWNSDHQSGPCPDSWIATPVKDLVQGWVDGTIPNYGITGRVSPVNDYSDNYSYKEFQKHNANPGGQLLTVVWTPYRAGYTLGSYQLPTNNTPGWIDVWVENKSAGALPWNAGGSNPFYLGYHVYDATGTNLIAWDSVLSPLPYDLDQNRPGGWIRATISPLPPGQYILKWDMVHFGVVWFSQIAADDGLLPKEFGIVPILNIPAHLTEIDPVGVTDVRTPTLRVSAVNPDAWPSNTIQYWFQICEDQGMSQGCVHSGWQSANTWQPTHLKWGKTYYWQAHLNEPGGVSTWSPWTLPLTPSVTQPKVEKHFGTDPYAPLHGGVNPSIGNYVASFTDVTVAAAGLPIEWTRTYNSMDKRVGSFGEGWSTFLELKAEPEGPEKLLVSFPDGRQERYARNADGTWQGGQGNVSVLRDRSGGGWELQRPDQIVYAFDNGGRPVEIRNGSGHTLTLVWGSSGRVDKITTQPSGRSLFLTWEAKGPGSPSKYVVTKVKTDPVTVEGVTRTPEWTYSYEGGRLKTSCVPPAAPNCTTYSWFTTGQSAGKLQKIVKPEGNDAVELGYQADGSVSWVENGLNNKWSFKDDDDAAEGTYHPIEGNRAYGQTAPANATTVVDVTGIGGSAGVPETGVQAVVVDVEVAAPTGGGWLQAYPSGTPEPEPFVSTMDYSPGIARSTLHTVAVGADGKIALANHGPQLNLIVDVVGWYGKAGVTGGSVFVPLPAKRVLDTRTTGQGPRLGPGDVRTIDLTGVGDVPEEGVTAVAYNLEMVVPTAHTWLEAYPKGATTREISTAVTQAGQTDNLHITKVDDQGRIELENANGSLDVLIDVVGYFADPAIHEGGNVFRPVKNHRLVDSRGTTGQWITPWPGGATRPVLVAGEGPIPERGITGVVGEIQAVASPREELVFTNPSGEPPEATTYIAQANQTVGNAIYSGLGDNGAFDLKVGNTPEHMIIDVVGYFTPVPRTVTATDPAAGKVEYRFDELGRLTGVVDQEGFKTGYSYNDRGMFASTTDGTGATHAYTYDDDGHVVSDKVAQLSAAGAETWSSTSYYGYVDDPAAPARDGKLAWVADGRSVDAADTTYRTAYTYDDLGQPLTVRGPDGEGVTRTYTTESSPVVGPGSAPLGLLETATDAVGLTTTYGYDSKGDLREVIHPGGAKDAFAYDQLGRVVSRTEHSTAYPSGLTSSRVYDDLSRPVKELGPVFTSPLTTNRQTRTATTYWPNGEPKRVTTDDAISNGEDRWVEFAYDDADRVIGTTDNNGRTTTREYDSRGNVRAETAVDGARVEHSYSPRNLRTLTIAKNVVDDPVGAPATKRDVLLVWNGYDAAGRHTTMVDSMSRVTRQAWRADGEPEIAYAANVRNTDRDTGLPSGGEHSVLLAASRLDSAGNVIEAFSPSNVSYRDEFAGSALGAGWSATSTWSVGGGELKSTGVGIARRAGAADGMVSVTAGSAAPASAAFRVVDNSNYHRTDFVKFGAVGVVTISRVSNGTATSVGSAVIPTPPEEGDRIETVFVGPRMWVLVDGSIALTATDATREDTTGVGVAATAAAQEAGSFRFDAYLRTANTFDAYGRLTSSVLDPGGADQKLAYTLDEAGRPTEVRRSRATSPSTTEVTRFEYDPAGHLDWTEQDIDGGVARTDHIVDDRGRTTAVVSPEGARVDLAYDEVGRVLSITEPVRTVERHGQAAAPNTRPVSTFGYNAFGERFVSRDPAGRTVTDSIDGRGFVTATTYPAYTAPGGTAQNRTTSTGFDNAGRVTSYTNLANQKTDLTYNTLGLLVQTKDPAVGGQPRGVARTRYDDGGRPVEQVDQNGAIGRSRWDDLDRLSGTEEVVRQPALASNVSGFSVGDAGGVLRSRTPAGVLATAEYDVAGRQTRTIDAAGNATTYTYDQLSRPFQVTTPDGRSTKSFYSLAGDPIRAEFYGPTGTLLGSTTARYDKDHRVVETRTPNGVAGNYGTTFAYDAAGHLTTRTTPVASGQTITESFGYDELGRATRYTDGNLNATWQTYNSMDLPEDGIAPAAGPHTAEADRRWRSVYDVAGRPITQTAPGGITTTTAYDELGRVKQQSSTGAAATTDTRSYEWDLVGQLKKATVPAGSQTFSYDDRGLLLSATGIAGDSSFVYDADGRVTKRTDSSGITDFTYDNRGLPDTMTSSLSGTVSFDFDSVGRPTLVDYGTTERTFTHDGWGRTDVDKLATGTNVLYMADYGYDGDGNITSKATSGTGVPAAGANTYGYDRGGRITSWTAPGRPAETYGWDGASNRTQAGSTTASYDQQNRLTAVTSADGQTTNSWNSNGTLSQTTTTPAQRKVSLVVANPAALTAAETSLRDRYGAAGAAVAIVDDNAAAPTAGVDVVIISPNVDAAALADKYKALAAPVVNLAAGTWQNSGLTSAAPTTTSSSTANAATPAHPVAAGKTGNVALLSSADTLNRATAASLGSGAARVWTTTGSSTDTVVAAYDTATTTPGGAAPARRVAVGYSSGAVAKLNADGWAVLDAAVAWADNNPLVAGTTSYKHDGFEQLRQVNASGNTTNYNYDAVSRRLNSPTGNLTYSGAGIRPSADGATRSQPGPTGTIAVDDLATGGGTWAHADGHTDVVGTFTNNATSLVGSQTFSPWGQPLGKAGAAIPLGYQSERQDLPGGLIGMGVREYNPNTGTFTTRDPANDPAVRNGYSYTPANPMGYTDPTGAAVADQCEKINPTRKKCQGPGGIYHCYYHPGLRRWICDNSGGGGGTGSSGQGCPNGGMPPGCTLKPPGGNPPPPPPPNGNPPPPPGSPRPGGGAGGGGGGSGGGGYGPGGGPGTPASSAPPREPSALEQQITATGSAVPNYDGRYQTDPSTGQLVDTGSSSISQGTTNFLANDLPHAPVPQLIQTAMADATGGGGHPPIPDFDSQDKKVGGVDLRLRGYLSDDCLFLFECSGNEQIAQALSIRAWSETPRSGPLAFMNIPNTIDWEIRKPGPFQDELDDRYRVDILTHDDQNEWLISEVKHYDGPSTIEDVEEQLDRYTGMLEKITKGQGIIIGKDPAFENAGGGTGVIGVFEGRPDWKGDQDPYVVWSPEPGHIYFDKLDRIENRAEHDDDWEVIADEASRIIRNGQSVNGWPGVNYPGEGAPTVIPLPVPVPVPVPL